MQISAVQIANRIRMARSQYDGCYLLLEGAGDAKFFGKFTHRTRVRFIDSQGKHVALEAIRILNREAATGVLMVADADFDRIPPRSLPTDDNVLFYDHHDLEVFLMMSPALETVLRELGSNEKIARLEAAGATVRELLLSVGARIGALRLASHDEKWSLKFDEGKYASFVKDRIDVPLLDIVNEIRNRSQAYALAEKEVLSKVQAILDADPPVTELVVGHDLTAILSSWLRRSIGSQDAADVAVERIESLLRAAFERRYFETSRLHRELKAWESNAGRGPLFAD